MSWQHSVLMALLIAEALLAIGRIGRPRPTLSSVEATLQVGEIVLIGWLAVTG